MIGRPHTMPQRSDFPWLPPTAWPYRLFLGLWMLVYAGFYGFGTYAAYSKGLPVSVLSTTVILGLLAAAAATVWFSPRIGWFLALLGTAALGWRLFRSMGMALPGIVIGALIHIPVLAGIPIGWLEMRRNAARPRSAAPNPHRKV